MVCALGLPLVRVALAGCVVASSSVQPDAGSDETDEISMLQLLKLHPDFSGYGPGNVGACRTADGDGDGGMGMYSGANVDNVEQCASACDASPTCFAFEFTGVNTGIASCELHRQPMPAATGHPNGWCYNKRPGGPYLEGFDAARVGACRRANGDGGVGMFSTANVDNVAQCALACDASPTCLAFEFTGVNTGINGCELHRQPMPAATGHPNGLCYNRILAGFGYPNVGACRTADGDGGIGMFSSADVDNVAQCATACDASSTCFAFEFTGVTTGIASCELHRQPMPAVSGHPNGLCYNSLKEDLVTNTD